MTVVNFNGRAYTPQVLGTMEMSELVDLHNRVAALRDGPEAWGFASLAEARELTWLMLLRLDTKTETQAPPVDPPSWYPPPAPNLRVTHRRTEPAVEKVRVSRLKRFKFPPTSKVTPPRAGTLRALVLELLSRDTGGTFAEVLEMVKTFDGQRGVEEKNVERRAYEVIRLLHYYNGYGLAHEGDQIRVNVGK